MRGCTRLGGLLATQGRRRSFTDYLREAVGLSPLWACRTRSTTILVMSISRSGTSLPSVQAYSTFAMTARCRT